MSSEGWQDLRGRLPQALGARQLALGAAILLGLVGGALAYRNPTTAVILAIVLAGIFGLAVLGERAFPWAVVIVAVIPWFPFISEAAEPPIVKQKVIASAVAAAPLAPWLWSLAMSGRKTRPSRATLLMGVLFAGLAVLIYDTLGSVSQMISSGIVGFLFIGVTFLCARRFGQARGWLAASFGGLLVLGLLGADAYVRAPSNRIGYFVGYPITYGALVVGLLPPALLYAYQRSRLLAGAVAAGSAALLIFSESRSSWVAATVILIVAVVLQARAGNFRALGAVVAIVVLLGALVLGTGTLHNIVEKKLSSNITTTQSVTHRQWSYGYALETIGNAPVFGAGAPGFSARESANKTNIGAIDNGYLSITVDMGLIGLFAALIPIGVALRVLWRCLRFGVTPRLEVSLALGIVGMAVVTAFYDSFYWAQIDLLLGAMGGVLSVRSATITGKRVAVQGHAPGAGRRLGLRWAT
ncbi:MAG TPA: O-antigen ligase family protein [Solirubrobacteraceae bacterium]|jgi:O-antigen ligase